MSDIINNHKNTSLSSPAGWLLDITKLTLGESIGEGEFGGECLFYLCINTTFATSSKVVFVWISVRLCVCLGPSAVHEGEYMGQRVAVKTIKCDVTAQAFLQETTVMT